MSTIKAYFILLAFIVIALVVGLAVLGAGAGTDAQPVDVGYTIIQDGQNAIRQAGSEVKQVITDNPALLKPTDVDANTDGIIDILLDVINEEAGK